MICPNCGRQISDTAKFCSGCGMPIDSSAAENDKISNSAVISENAQSPTDFGVNRGKNGGVWGKSGEFYAGENTVGRKTAEKAKKRYDESPMAVSDYLMTRVIAMIPLFGLIYLFYVIFTTDNINRKNHAISAVVMSVFSLILWVAFFTGVLFARPLA